jgi:hypothetical protein
MKTEELYNMSGYELCMKNETSYLMEMLFRDTFEVYS